jgi:hypothetical protein
VNQDEQTRERLAHHFTPPTQEKYMKSVDIELMLSVEEEGRRERLELDSWPEITRLVAQCSILVGIVGIIAGLIAS